MVFEKRGELFCNFKYTDTLLISHSVGCVTSDVIKVETHSNDVNNLDANASFFGDQTGVDRIFVLILLTSPRFEFDFANFCGCKLNVLDPEVDSLLV